MAFDKSGYGDDNVSVVDFYHALSDSLKRTPKEPLAVFEQLLDAGLMVSLGPLGYVGDTPINAGDIKVAIRKAQCDGKHCEEVFDVPIMIPVLNASEHMSSQKLAEFRKQDRVLRNKLELAIKRKEHDKIKELTREVRAHSESLHSSFEVNLSELYVNHANADAACRVLGEDSCPWPGKKTPRQQTDPLLIFQNMDELKFHEITIRADDENVTLRVSARDKKNIAIPFNTLGLTKRNEVVLSQPGKVFLQMANGSSVDISQKGVKSARERLSKILRIAFKTQDTPFIRGVPQFRLTIPRDNREKQKAVRRTSSYNDDQANEYLKKTDRQYDPDYDIYSSDPDLGAGD